MEQEPASPIRVEITDASEFYCFRMLINPSSAPDQTIEIMIHARALVQLIHQASTALCIWQGQTTSMLIQKLTGLAEQEAREKGLIA